MGGHVGISFSHPEEAQVTEQLSIRAWRKNALLFQGKQQRLYGSQILWDCSSDSLHTNNSYLTICLTGHNPQMPTQLPCQTCTSLDIAIAAERIAVCSHGYGALRKNKLTRV